MTSPLSRAADRISAELLRRSPECGPSAVAIGVSDASQDILSKVCGHAQTLAQTLAHTGPLVPPAPLSAEPVFDVGSVTKVAVTTSLCMRLVDDGRLRLDTPVARWFPGFAAETQHAQTQHAVTVRDLLEHQGGLWEWWPAYVDGAQTADDAIGSVQRLPLRYRPGAGRHYSDLGFMLLGEIVAREYGVPLDAAADREILAPLGMRVSGYRARDAAPCAEPPAGAPVATSLGDWYERRMIDSGSPYPVPVATGTFSRWRTHPLVGEVNDGNCWHAFGGVAGHAGLFTSAPDLLRLGRALLASLDGDGPWTSDVVELFLCPGRDAGQGLGFRVRPGATGPMVEHPGFPGARFAVLPARRRVAVLLTNRLHTLGEPPTVDAAWSELIEAVEAA